MKSKMNLKKGFTIWEIAFGILLITTLYMTSLPFQKSKQYEDKTLVFTNNLVNLISIAVFDIHKGYATNTGGDCSNNYTVTNISAEKVNLCTNLALTSNITKTGTFDKDIGADSYLSLFKVHGGECKVFLDDVDAYTLRMYADCSTQVLSDKFEALEQIVISQISKKLNLMYISHNLNAEDLTGATAGTNKDGKFSIDFRK